MEFTYFIFDEYILEDIKIHKFLKKFMIKDNKFCRDTDFPDFLGDSSNFFLLYDNDELCAATAITFDLVEDKTKIEGINIHFFCSRKAGYEGFLLQKIIDISDSNEWFIKLKPTNERNKKFYEKYNFIKNGEYHYYNI